MRTLNRAFRGVDRATDVLSFPTAPDAGGAADDALGDVVIAAGVATRQAVAAGHTLRTELRVLALHGLLHLLGYDHEHDDGVMARTERRLRRRGQLREGLIERAHRRRRARGAGRDAAGAVPPCLRRGAVRHRLGRVQRADAAVAAPLGRAERP